MPDANQAETPRFTYRDLRSPGNYRGFDGDQEFVLLSDHETVVAALEGARFDAEEREELLHDRVLVAEARLTKQREAIEAARTHFQRYYDSLGNRGIPNHRKEVAGSAIRKLDELLAGFTAPTRMDALLAALQVERKRLCLWIGRHEEVEEFADWVNMPDDHPRREFWMGINADAMEALFPLRNLRGHIDAVAAALSVRSEEGQDA